jgi:hypothetical protein
MDTMSVLRVRCRYSVLDTDCHWIAVSFVQMQRDGAHENESLYYFTKYFHKE